VHARRGANALANALCHLVAMGAVVALVLKGKSVAF